MTNDDEIDVDQAFADGLIERHEINGHIVYTGPGGREAIEQAARDDEWRGRPVGEAPRNPYGLPRVAYVEREPFARLDGWGAVRIVPEVPGCNRRERRASAAVMRREDKRRAVPRVRR